MRHGKKFNSLSRKAGHRTAMLRNMSVSLIMHKRIFTTLPKAKALKKHVEPIITKGKKNTVHSQRIAFKYLQDKAAVMELFGPVATAVGDRPGGYTRIIRTGYRQHDGALMAMIELVDFNETVSQQAKSGGGRRRRRRRGGGAAAGGTMNTPNEMKHQNEEE